MFTAARAAKDEAAGFEKIAAAKAQMAAAGPGAVVEVDADLLTTTFGDPTLYDARPGCSTTIPEKDVKVAIADEAKNIVAGARRAAYGKPEQNFERIARFWHAYFVNRGLTLRDGNGAPHEITAADVSPMMRLMKEARLCETPDHRDSFVDLVGYTLTGAEVNGVKA